jgi:hypothetical protein
MNSPPSTRIARGGEKMTLSVSFARCVKAVERGSYERGSRLEGRDDDDCGRTTPPSFPRATRCASFTAML